MTDAVQVAGGVAQSSLSLPTKILIGGATLTAFSAVVAASVSISISTSPIVIRGVTAYGQSLSGMTRPQVQSFFMQYYLNHAAPIELSDGSRTWYINADDVDYKANIDQVTDEIFGLGRDGNFFTNVEEQINCYMHPRDFSLMGTYSPEKLNAKLNSIAADIHIDPVNAECYMQNGTIVKIPGVVGRKWDYDLTAQALDAPYRNLNPPTQMPITPTTIQPFLSTEDIAPIDTIIGQYSTEYYPGDRGDNIGIAASKLNNVTIKPGCTFSFNDQVGERTYANGFLPAPVIVNGKHEIGIGGGVCQVSTTLYNAALLADLTPVERCAHYFPSSYVAPGRDATVADGWLDLKLMNNLPHAVALAAYASGDVVTCYILGSSADIAGKSVSIYTEGDSMHPSVYRVVTVNGATTYEYLHTDVYYEDEE